MAPPPKDEPSWAPVLRAVICTSFTLGWWYSINSWSFRPSTFLWRWYFLLPSFLLTLAYRYYRGGREEFLRELWHVQDDLTKPPRICFKSYHLSWRDSYEQLLASIAVLFSYSYAYGPFCYLSHLCFYSPCVSIYKVVGMYQAGGMTNPQVALWVFVMFIFICFSQSAIPFGMHRYFSHRCFETSRVFNFMVGCYSCVAKQRGPMWWASTHRRHHKHCETKLDPHCPGVQGWFYSHFGWLTNRDNFYIRLNLVRDWLKLYPELLLFDVFFNHVAVLGLVSFEPIVRNLVTALWKDALPKGFFMHAANTAGPISMHLIFATNSFCHTWKEPANLEDIYPGVHWSVVNGGENNPSTKPSAESSPNNPQDGDGASKAVDIHGHAQADKKEPCVGLDNVFLGLWYGDGYHGRHHQNAKLARHAPVWYLDYHYCIICGLESLGIVWNVQREKYTGKKESKDE